MREVLSLILVLMMLVSIVPVSIFADEAEMPAEANAPVAAEDESTTSEIIASGYCGGDTTAEYDEASGAYKNLFSWLPF